MPEVRETIARVPAKGRASHREPIDDIASKREADRSKTAPTENAIRERGRVETTEQRGSNGLARLAGTWTDEEFQEFEAAVAEFEELDEEMWL